MAARSSILVVAIAAATGVVAARGASALGDHVAAREAAAAFVVAPTPLRALGGPGHGEGETDEARGTAGDNPYDEAVPAPHGVARVAVLAQGGMLRLPAGRFIVGSLNPRLPPNERAVHSVAIAPFWIDRTEVTVASYRACVEAGGCVRPARASATCTYDAGDGELPVSCVHWHDADAYCHFVGKRLPTELEWEYAARGNLTIPFPWGGGTSCSNAVTLINDQSGKSCAARPARVGSHPNGASLFGVQDLSGNVEEWTADWYSESLVAAGAPRAGSAHVLRGGGWLSPPSLSRTTARDWGSALEAGPNVGLRCARDE